MKLLLGPEVRDARLPVVACLLTLFGIAMIHSAGVLNVPSPVTQHAWIRQLVWFGLGLAAYSVVVRLPFSWIHGAVWPLYLFATLLLASTLLIGTGRGTAEGVKSWLSVGGLNLQPAEVAKVALILALARLISKWKEPPATLKDLLLPASLALAPIAILAYQPDIGTATAFVGILFAMLYWAGTPLVALILLGSPALGLVLSFHTLVWSAYFLCLGLFLLLHRRRFYFVESLGVLLLNLAAGTVARPLWNFLAEYQRNRLLVFIDPNIDPRGAGWNLIQSKVAVGSGGLTGKGFTMGSQKRLDFLPEQHTDFIFSVVGEELGFVGVILAIAAFAYLLLRLVGMAAESSDPFAGLVIFGIFGALFVHIFVNIGMTVGLVPIIGIPLPFVSYGGSFLLMSWVAVALAARLGSEKEGSSHGLVP